MALSALDARCYSLIVQHLHPSTQSMSASRAFNAAVDGSYWLARLHEDFPLDTDPHARGTVVQDWRNDEVGEWFCYWDDSDDMPNNPKEDFVFCPALEIAKCGVVRTAVWDLLSADRPEVLYRALHRVMLLSVAGVSIGMGGEGDGPWLPCICPAMARPRAAHATQSTDWPA